jgi:hypothetical protein
LVLWGEWVGRWLIINWLDGEKGYPELGMEAIWKIEVVDFPAFILVDDKGNDFFRRLE